MRKFYYLIVICFFLVSCFDTGHAKVIQIESITDNTEVNDDFSENSGINEGFSSGLKAQSRLSFDPPAIGEVGVWLPLGSIMSDAEAKQYVLNTYMPSFIGESVSYNGLLGANVGDTLKLTVGAKSLVNLNFYSFSNTAYVPLVSWYGQVMVSDVSAVSNSSSVTVNVSKLSSGNYEIQLTRNKAEKEENYEITLKYNYTLEYYVSMYINPPLGSGWSAWTAANTETLQSKSTKINVPAEPMSDNLSAEVVSQSINMGTDISSLNIKNFVKNVKLGDTTLSSSKYTVELLDSTIDVSQVGDLKANVRVTATSDSSKTIDLEVPISVLWGNTLLAKDAAYASVVASVSMLDNNGTPKLVATKGDGLSTLSDIWSRPILYFFDKDLNNPVKTISYETIEQSATNLMNLWNTNFNSVNNTLKYGDVISFKVFRRSNESLNYNGANTWVSRNEQLVKETEGYGEAFYELTKSGYSLLHINQLTTNTIEVPIYSSKDYLDSRISELINLNGYSNISIKGFSEYPNVNSSGKQTGEVTVQETLSSGEKIDYSYQVAVNVGQGSLGIAAPQKLTFEDYTISKGISLLRRTETSFSLIINDSRGEGNQGNWKLTAEIKNPNDEIAPYIFYRENAEESSNDKYLSNGAVEIYTALTDENNEEPLQVNVAGAWKRSSGILLRFPSNTKIDAKNYSTTITWNLVEGP